MRFFLLLCAALLLRPTDAQYTDLNWGYASACSPTPGLGYWLQAVDSDLVFNVGGNEKDDPLTLETASESLFQIFSFDLVGVGLYRLVNVGSDKALEVASGDDGATLTQQDFSNSPYQEFTLLDGPNGEACYLVVMDNSKNIEALGATPGSSVGQNPPTDASPQLWKLVEANCPTFELAWPFAVVNGRWLSPSLNELNVNEDANIECNEGFTLDGPATYHCGIFGKWEPPEFTTQCSRPCLMEELEVGAVEGLTVQVPNPDNIMGGDIATVTCTEANQNIMGPETYRCRRDGTWEEKFSSSCVASCNWKDLNPSLSITRGTLNFKDTDRILEGDRGTVFCQNRYVVVGDANYWCGEDGTWDKPFNATCQLITRTVAATVFSDPCQPQPSQNYYLVNKASGEVAEVQGGSVGRGAPLVLGEAVGDPWEMFFFSYITQGVFGFIALHSQNVIKVNPPNTDVIQSPAYKQTNNERFKITPAGGQWCYISNWETELFVQPESPVGGSPLTTTEFTGTDDQQWQIIPAACAVSKLKLDPFVDNGYLNTRSYFEIQYGKTLEVVCNDGFILLGVETYTCGIMGEWDQEFDTICQKPCSDIELHDPFTIENGELKGLQPYLIGDEVEITCNEGYNLEGTDKYTCIETSVWDSAWDSVCTEKITIPTSSACEPLALVSPFVLENGNINVPDPNKIVTGDVAVITCNDGYASSNRIEYSCTPDGTWSHLFDAECLPTCDKLLLVSPFLLGNGAIDLPDENLIKAGDVAEITCNAGFVPSGVLSYECTEIGTWSQGFSSTCAATCDPASLVDPLTLDFGLISLPNEELVVAGDVATVTCNTDYALEGHATYTCGDLGQWSDNFNTECKRMCYANDLIQDLAIADGSIDVTDALNIKDGDVATVSCSPGFSLQGPSSYTCSDGDWLNAIFSSSCVQVCKPTDLLDPLTMPNGLVGVSSQVEVTVGEKATILCNPGFALRGDPTYTCEADGTWNNEFTSQCIEACKPADLNDPFSVSNGLLTVPNPASIVSGDTAEVSCNPGFALDGPAQYTCNAGTWDQKFSTTCLPTCDKDGLVIPFGLTNGVITVPNDDEIVAGDAATVSCNAGFTLEGPVVYECSALGKWSSKLESRCIPNCSPLDLANPFGLDNGAINVDNADIAHGDVATVVCNEGFVSSGETSYECVEGEWSSTLTTECIATCDPNELNGYQVTNGAFDGPADAVFSAGVSVNIVCNEGYAAIGQIAYTCTNLGSWDQTYSGDCVATCPAIALVPSLTVPEGVLTFSKDVPLLPAGETATVTCNPGFAIEGPSTYTCGAFGTWGQDFASTCVATCAPEDLFNPFSVDNGVFAPADSAVFKAGESVSVVCNDDFSPLGPVEYTCNLLGQWDQEYMTYCAPTCKPTDLVNPFSVDSGTISTPNPLEVVAGDVATVVCNPGYENGGSKTYACGMDGKWEKDFDSNCAKLCNPLELQAPFTINQGQFNLDPTAEVSSGEVVTISCNEGHAIEGPESYTCNVGGTWDQSFGSECVPVCETTDLKKPFTLANGELTIIGTIPLTSGESVALSCNPGFAVVGPEAYTCNGLGDWNQNFNSTCLPTCPNADLYQRIDNGHLVFEDEGDNEAEPGQKATVVCDPGYVMTGPDAYTCTAQGTWDRDFTSVCTATCNPDDLLSPLLIDDGTITVPGATIVAHDIATVSCTPGYALLGPSSYTCQEDGKWNSEFMSGCLQKCDPLDLINPFGVDDGNIDVDDVNMIIEGAAVTVSCNEEYTPVGPTTYTCGAAGMWNDEFQSYCTKTCNPDDLLFPLSLPNTEFIVPHTGNLMPSEVIEVQCDAGFTPLGPTTYECTPLGSWKQEYTTGCVALCSAEKLQDPFVVPGGTININDENLIMAGDVASVTCDDGTALIGPKTYTCGPLGEWETKFDTECEKTCKPQDLAAFVNNGQLSLVEPVLAGDKATVTCGPGYALNGPATYTCTVIGAWDDDFSSTCVPICNPENLADPFALENGQFDVTGDGIVPVSGDTATVTCNPGNVLEGPETYTCGADGTWNAPLTSKCVAVCGANELVNPFDINDGKITVDNVADIRVGNEAVISCDDGFMLEGPEKYTCGEDGQWDNAFSSQCVPYCKIKVVPENGKSTPPIDSILKVGDTSVLRCRTGFGLVGPDTYTCVGPAEWNVPMTSVCQPRCAREGVAKLNNGGLVFEGDDDVTTFGEIVTVRCNPGFVLEGPEIYNCNENGLWNADFTSRCIAECIATDLVSPVNLANGAILFRDEDNILEGETAQLNCHIGFMLQGPSEYKCLHDGTWDKEMTTNCIKICPTKDLLDPLSIPNGEFNTDRTEAISGDSVAVTCLPGYKLVGPTSYECLPSGVWDNEFVNECKALCVATELIDPLVTKEGFIAVRDAAEVLAGEVATVTCNPGTMLVGPDEYTCLDDGKWNQNWQSDCLNTCTVDELVEGGELPSGTLDVLPVSIIEDSAVAQCNDGYELIGDAKYTCQLDGTWDKPWNAECKARCDPIALVPSLDLLDGVLSIPDLPIEGTVVTAACKDGFALIGPDEYTCTDLGDWSSPFGSKCTKTCNSRDLLFPASIPSGNLHFENPNLVLAGEIATVTCQDGHRADGPVTYECNTLGEWSQEFVSQCVPTCKPDALTDPFTVTNGDLHIHDDKEILDVGDGVKVSCEEGYAVEGAERYQCIGLDTFDRAFNSLCVPVCNPDDLVFPLKIENGQLELTDENKIVVGDIAAVSCAEGFGRNGPSSYTCVEQEGKVQWDESFTSECLPVCEATGLVKTIDNGFLTFAIDDSPNVALGGEIVTVECNEGYVMEGPETYACDETGSWNKKFDTTCVPMCLPQDLKEPLTFDNGQIELPPTPIISFKDKIQVSCEDGYVLEGPTDYQCTIYGGWNKDFSSTCIKTCNVDDLLAPLDIPFGVIKSENDKIAQDGDVIEVVCDINYERTGPSSYTCTSTGDWNSEFQTMCIPTCTPNDLKAPLTTPYGTITVPEGERVAMGEKAVVTCDAGHTIIGPVEYTCTELGAWDTSFVSYCAATCDPTSLLDPFDIEYGKINVYDEDRIIAGESAVVTCDPDYNLVGPKIYECTGAGSWSAEFNSQCQPTCSKTSLLDPFVAPETSLDAGPDDRVAKGKAVTVTCTDGHILKGPTSYTCVGEDKWDDEYQSVCVPTCSKENLISPFIFLNGEIQIDNEDEILAGDSLSLSCNSGFGLRGPKKYTCDKEGGVVSWQTPMSSACVPLCEADGLVTTIENGQMTFEDADSEIRSGEVVNIECLPGYILEGSSVYSCNDDGTWNEQYDSVCVALCRHQDLLDPLTFPDGEIAIDDLLEIRAGDVATVTCAPTFELMGPSVYECTALGKWNQEFQSMCMPTCARVDLINFDFPNGAITESEDRVELGTVLEVTCDKGHVNFLDVDKYECTQDGWSSEFMSACVAECKPEDLINPFNLPDGDIRLQDVNLVVNGQSATIECDENYQLQGPDTYTCTSAGTWDQEMVSYCVRKCVLPDLTPEAALPNGGITLQRDDLILANDVATVQCDAQYKLSGPEEYSCTEIGSWNILFDTTCVPTCTKESLINPYQIVGGILDQVTEDIVAGDIISITCNDGYAISGPAQYTCTDVDTWDQAFETKCEPICSTTGLQDPFAIKNGDITVERPERIAVGDQATISCLDGFALVGPESYTCLDFGVWNPAFTSTCQPQCSATGLATVIDNGALDFAAAGAEITDGEVVTVVCNEGTILEGPETYSCNAEGEWDKEFASYCTQTCNAVDLVPLFQVDNGKIKVNDPALILADEVATVECGDGFQLKGPSEYRCSLLGEWNAEFTSVCQRVCSKTDLVNPFEIGRGEIAGPDGPTVVEGESVTVSCSPENRLTGPTEYKCMPSGDWDKEFITLCEPTCNPQELLTPLEVPNAVIQVADQNEILHGEELSVTCDAGYQIMGPTVYSCSETGEWTQEFVSGCIRTCPVPNLLEPLSIPDAEIYVPDPVAVLEGQAATVTCSPGHALQGPDRYECNSLGAWDQEFMSYCAKECLITSLPTVVPNGELIQSNPAQIIAGDVVTVQCEPGNALVGPAKYICGDDGSFNTPFESECIKTCDLPDLHSTQSIDGGTIEVDNSVQILVGDTATVSCDNGHSLSGPTEYTCQANGRWDKEFKSECISTCDAVALTDPFSIQNGLIDVANQAQVVLGDVATVTCNDGYKTEGPETYKCLANGAWDQPFLTTCTPACDPEDLQAPFTIPNGDITVPDIDFVRVLDTAVVNCKPGFGIHGTESYKCAAAGTWDKKFDSVCKPQCEQGGFDINIDNGKLLFEDDDNAFLSGETVKVSCDDGFVMVGPETYVCNADGVWDQAYDTKCVATCAVPSLLSPLEIPDGAITVSDPTKVMAGEIATVSCEGGDSVILKGPSEYRCMEDGKWNEEFTSHCAHTCSARTLVNPFEILDGLLDVPNVDLIEAGTQVEVVCDEYFVQKGPAFYECQLDGTWDEEFTSYCEPSCDPFDLADPFQIDNGKINIPNIDLIKIGDKAEVVCNDGYANKAPAVYECVLHDDFAEWDMKFNAECKKECTLPDSLTTESETHKLEYTFPMVAGEPVVLTCSVGMVSVGTTSVINCQEDGTWDDGAPDMKCMGKCEFDGPTEDLISNGKVIMPEGGEVIADGITAPATVECDPGFLLIGPKEYHCGTFGDWEVAFQSSCVPMCDTDDLLTPLEIPDGTAVASNPEAMVADTTVKVTCESSHKLMGPDTYTCNALGAWDQEFVSYCEPTCTAQSLTPTVSIESGLLSITPTTKTDLNGQVTVSCNEGYTLHGPKTYTCVDLNSWSEPFNTQCRPSCEPEGLSDPLHVDNGVVVLPDPDQILVGEQAVIECNEGFGLEGLSAYTCIGPNLWDVPFGSQCLPSCEAAGLAMSIENGLLTFEDDDITSGEKVTVSCLDEFILTGPTEYVCNADGQWDKAFNSACVAKCVDTELVEPFQIEGGVISLTDPTQILAKHKADITCNEGYELSGPAKYTCNVNGKWGKPFTSECIKTCTTVSLIAPFELPMGKIEAANEIAILAGDSVTLSCDEGNHLTGPQSYTCNGDGTWSEEFISGCLPICQPADLLNPLQMPGAVFIGPEGVIIAEDTITVACDKGYFQTGPTEYTCTVLGSWDQEFTTLCMPTCDPDNLMVPLEIPSGTIAVVEPILPGGEAVVTCEPGFARIGPETYTCLDSQNWDQEYQSYCTPVCKSADLVGSVDGGQVLYPNPDLIVAGDVATIDCNEGYALVGSGLYTCTDSGWDNPYESSCVKKCSPDDLSVPFSTLNGILQVPNLAQILPGDDATVVCNPGHVVMDGPETYKCTENGWDAELTSWCKPSCSVSDLKEPLEVADGTVTLTNPELITQGDTAVIECAEGHILQGTETYTCTDLSTWDHPFSSACLPACKATDLVPNYLLTNGQLNPPTADFVVAGESVTANCGEGFGLMGSDVYTCSGPDAWDKEFDTVCQPLCETDGLTLNIENGQLTYQDSDTTVYAGEVVNVVCDPGFSLLGPASYTCDSGTWNTPYDSQCTAICLPADLVPSMSIIGGDITLSNPETSTEGDLAVVNCKDGYELSGIDTYTCLDTGKWSTEFQAECISTCKTEDLINFPFPSGTVNLPDSGIARSGDTVTVECDEGFQNMGPDSYTCVALGEWNSEFMSYCQPTCKPDDLSPGLLITDGLITMDNADSATILSGQTASVVCNPGTELVGPATYTCGENGEWNAPLDSTCTPVCPIANLMDPFEMPNGDFVLPDPTQALLGEQVSVSCKDGFLLAGPETYTCLIGGKWDSEMISYCIPTCKPTDLVASLTLDNGDISVSNEEAVQAGEVLTVSCGIGHVLVGPDSYSCTELRAWDKSFSSECVAQCDKNDLLFPLEIPDGTISLTNPDQITFGNKATVTCEEGFVRNGPKTYTCNAAGKWDQEYLTFCEPTCTPDSLLVDRNVPNGHWDIPDLIKAGDHLSFSCDDGFVVDGPDRYTCTGKDQWDDEFRTYCRPVCPVKMLKDPFHVENGDILTPSQEMLEVGETITVTCQLGFGLKGNHMYECKGDGTWDKLFDTTCIPTCINTGMDTLIENGALNFEGDNEFTDGEVVTVSCNEGYNLVGPEQYTCDATGEWDKQWATSCVALCNPLTLISPFLMTNGAINVGDVLNIEAGEKATIECNPGYALVGPSEYECTILGAWDKPFASTCTPTCKTNLLLSPLEIPSGQIVSGSGEELLEGETVTVSCDDDHVLAGPDTYTCTVTGEFNSEFLSYCQPTCEVSQLLDPFTLLNGKVKIDSLSVDNLALHNAGMVIVDEGVSAQCSDGFVLEGVAEYTCNGLGQWDQPFNAHCVKTCNDFDLLSPLEIPDGNIVLTNPTLIKEGDTAVVLCDEGFAQMGPAEYTCTGLGTWNQEYLTMCLKTCNRETLGTVTNGEIEFNAGENVIPGDTAAVSCRDGFVLAGPTVYNCGADGEWEEPMTTTCLPTCDSTMLLDPFTIPDGKIDIRDVSSIVVGDIATPSCNDGFTLQGTPEYTCGTDGNWDQVEFLSWCQPSCSPPDLVTPDGYQFGTVTFELVEGGDSVLSGGVATVVCEEGFVPNGPMAYICQDDGSWNQPFASVCQPACNPEDLVAPFEVLNGTLIVANEAAILSGDTVTVSCDEGFEPNWATTYTCVQTGEDKAEWDHPFLTGCVDTCVWSGPFKSDDGDGGIPNVCPGYPISGVRCSGTSCDTMDIRQCKVHQGENCAWQDQTVSSAEGGNTEFTCPNGQFLGSLRCFEPGCSEIGFECCSFQAGQTADHGSAELGEPFGPEESEMLCPDDFAMIGMTVTGDSKAMQCAPITFTVQFLN